MNSEKTATAPSAQVRARSHTLARAPSSLDRGLVSKPSRPNVYATMAHYVGRLETIERESDLAYAEAQDHVHLMERDDADRLVVLRDAIDKEALIFPRFDARCLQSSL